VNLEASHYAECGRTSDAIEGSQGYLFMRPEISVTITMRNIKQSEHTFNALWSGRCRPRRCLKAARVSVTQR
jgi:hypothetical protein